MIRARGQQRAAFSMSHTQLCNFYRHSTLLSSCLPLHVAHFESGSPLFKCTSFVLYPSLCAWTVLLRHPQLHCASPHRLLRDIAHPPLPSSVMPNSSRSLLVLSRSPLLCPLACLNFVCAASSCLKHSVAATASIIVFFKLPLHVSVHLRKLVVEVALKNPCALV